MAIAGKALLESFILQPIRENICISLAANDMIIIYLCQNTAELWNKCYHSPLQPWRPSRWQPRAKASESIKLHFIRNSPKSLSSRALKPIRWPSKTRPTANVWAKPRPWGPTPRRGRARNAPSSKSRVLPPPAPMNWASMAKRPALMCSLTHWTT